MAKARPLPPAKPLDPALVKLVQALARQQVADEYRKADRKAATK